MVHPYNILYPGVMGKEGGLAYDEKDRKKSCAKMGFILFLDDSGSRSARADPGFGRGIAADRSWARGNVPGGRASC